MDGLQLRQREDLLFTAVGELGTDPTLDALFQYWARRLPAEDHPEFNAFHNLTYRLRQVRIEFQNAIQAVHDYYLVDEFGAIHKGWGFP